MAAPVQEYEIPVAEDIPWEGLLEELIGLDLFPSARLYGSWTDLWMDVFIETKHTICTMTVRVFKRDPTTVIVTVVEPPPISRPMSWNRIMRKLKGAIEYLIRIYETVPDPPA